jgi:hypothetical protein
MKVRLGYVSNSSSSSYVIITTKETLDKVLSKLTEFEAGAAKAIFNFEKQKVFGEDKMVSIEHVCTEDIGHDWDFLPEGVEPGDSEWEKAYEGINKFYNLISKEKDTFAKNIY